MSNRAFLIWLALLLPPVAVLFWLLNGGPVTPSVGGGGYDLGPFVYSWLLVLLSGGLTLIAALTGLGRGGRAASARAFALAALGAAVLVATLVLYGSDLT
jgi:hypothetical protein